MGPLFQNPKADRAYKALKGRYEEVKPGTRDWLTVQKLHVDSRKPLLKHNPTAAGGKRQWRSHWP